MSAHDHSNNSHDHADAWHHHSAAEGVPQHEHGAIANPGLLVRWFVGIVVTVAVLILALMIYFRSYTVRIKADRQETTLISRAANSAKAKADADLGTNGQPPQYTPLDKKAGTVQIPIDQAIEKVVERYSGSGQGASQPKN